MFPGEPVFALVLQQKIILPGKWAPARDKLSHPHKGSRSPQWAGVSLGEDGGARVPKVRDRLQGLFQMFSFQQVGKIHLGGQFNLGDKYWQCSVKGNAGSAPAPTLVSCGFGPLPVAAGPPLPLCAPPYAGLQVLGTPTPGAKCSWPSSMVNTWEIKAGEKKQRPDGHVYFFPFQPSGQRKSDYRKQKGMSFSSGCSHDSLGG